MVKCHILWSKLVIQVKRHQEAHDKTSEEDEKCPVCKMCVIGPRVVKDAPGWDEREANANEEDPDQRVSRCP